MYMYRYHNYNNNYYAVCIIYTLLDQSLIPRRVHAVTGVSILWQPEVVFPYLALLEKFTSTPELIEAAAGVLQNLTACAWKVT